MKKIYQIVFLCYTFVINLSHLHYIKFNLYFYVIYANIQHFGCYLTHCVNLNIQAYLFITLQARGAKLLSAHVVLLCSNSHKLNWFYILNEKIIVVFYVQL